jgi:hypothetical protein
MPLQGATWPSYTMPLPYYTLRCFAFARRNIAQPNYAFTTQCIAIQHIAIALHYLTLPSYSVPLHSFTLLCFAFALQCVTRPNYAMALYFSILSIVFELKKYFSVCFPS